jgi:hypothetical protein
MDYKYCYIEIYRITIIPDGRKIMEKRPFSDKSSKPTDITLKSTLKDLYPEYSSLMDTTSSFGKCWNFIKGSGWMMKVHKKNKALFYIIPLKNEFKISLTIRDEERSAFLEDDKLRMFQEIIQSAKKYREGYALVFQIIDSVSFGKFEIFIKKLIPYR